MTQKIKVTIPRVSGMKNFVGEWNINENIGLSAGRDVYATARGTAKSLARKINPFSWVWVNLVIDDHIFYHMCIENGAWVVEPPKEINR